MSNIDTAQEALPRGPMTEAGGEPSRSWRNYFESRSRRLGEVISGVNLNRQSIVDLSTSVTTNLGIETAARIAADAVVAADATSANATLSSTLTAAYQAADTTLLNNINTRATSAALTTESTVRASADSALASSITSLTAAYQAADTTLQANITSEASTRATADTALSTSITSLTATVGTNTASITTNSSAIATLNSSSAAYEVLVAASGGQPARIRLKAGIGGSTVEIDGNEVYFGAQTRFDTSTETFITEVGSVRSRYGTAFGSGASVVMWHGPTSVAQGSESRTNGYLAIGTNGLIYHNAAALEWGATAAEAAASNTWANFGARKGFNFLTTLEGVTCSASSTLTWVAGAAQWVTAATDQNVFTTLNLAGRFIPKIRMRVRPTSASFSWEGVVYYNTSGHAYSGSFYKAIGAPTGLAQNVWVIAEWDMTSLTAGGTDWIDNTIISTRFDISNGSGETWEIDWIAFGDFGPDPVGIRGIDDDADVTIANTAAAITGQGNLATANNARGTTGARATSTGSWSFYANTSTNTLQVDVPSSGWTDVATLSTALQTRGKIISGALSFSANSTWQEMATVDVTDVPVGGVIQVPYVDIVGQSLTGLPGSGYQWRLTEAPTSSPSTKTVIASGGFTTDGDDPPNILTIDQPSAALVAVTNTGSVRYKIEIQKTSGSGTIGLLATANFIINPG